jgi:hypothetical protein
MTIQQYLNKIKALCKNSNHTDLDNPAVKISLDNNKFYFNLSDLEFTNDQQKADRGEAILNPEIINQITDCLGLLFINEKGTEGNVCFVNSNELRPEFRQSFTSIDLLDYCYAILHSAINEFSEINSVRIPITSDSSIFWELVNYGSELRKKNSLK